MFCPRCFLHFKDKGDFNLHMWSCHDIDRAQEQPYRYGYGSFNHMEKVHEVKGWKPFSEGNRLRCANIEGSILRSFGVKDGKSSYVIDGSLSSIREGKSGTFLKAKDIDAVWRDSVMARTLEKVWLPVAGFEPLDRGDRPRITYIGARSS